MTDCSRSTPFPWWVRFADALTLGLLALAGAIFVTGGVRGRVHGALISSTTEWRPVLWAAIIAVVRHVAFRGDSLWHRVKPTLVALTETELYRRMTAGPALAGDELLPEPRTRVTVAELLLVAALMVVLTALMLSAQLARLDSVADLGDPLFSVWRLSWIAHQLPRDPLRLFQANIFYPERNTLAFSDSILLPGVVGAPFLWLGVSSLHLYNLFLLATFVLAGAAMYLLVRSLTGQPWAALVAAVIFAFYPFRFEHYSHFELQFSFWMPLALLALHRTVASGRLRDGLLTGGAIGGQTLSCLYFGVFLTAYFIPIWAALALGWNRVRSSVKPLLAGAGLAVVLIAPIAVPYVQVRQSFGERTAGEAEFYSARPQHYLVPHYTRTTYAGVLSRERHEPEKDAFPGILVVVLALVALWPPLTVPRIAYTLALAFAFEASLGMHGWLFPCLYRNFIPFRGFRVPARFSMLVGLSLSVLAGYGVARLGSYLRRPSLKYLLAAALTAVVLFESRTTLSLESVPQPHAIYQWLAARPTTVIAELPAATSDPASVGRDVRYSYFSTFHWHRLANGNSGYFPKSNLAFCDAMMTFPDDHSIRLLRDHDVEYVVLHEEYYGREAYRKVVDAVELRSDLREMARAVSGGYEARVYRLAR
jgi:hypothetical protein